MDGGLDEPRTMGLFMLNFPMSNVRDRINAHLPVVLKLVNTVALVVIALSSVCAADSLKEMSGKGAAPAAVTEAN